MRVVFVTHNYPRDAGDLAGAFLHPLARALQARGHEVRVVAPSDAGRGGRDLLDGVPVRRVRYGSPTRERYAYTGRMQEALASPAGWLALARLHRALRRAAREEARGGVDPVVHAHWWFPAGLAAPPELPCVVTLHGTDARLIPASPVTRALARRALRPPRVITAVSRAVADLAAPAMPGGIDQHHVSPMPVTETPRRSAGGQGIVFVGRLTTQKRLDLAIRALAALPPSVRLTIVGDGPARPALERLAGDSGLSERVQFRGRVAPDQVRPALEDADAFVFPARGEGFGLAVIEALLAGVPVAACRDGGGVLDALAVPGAGLVVEPDPESLAQALRTLIASPTARDAAHGAGCVWHDRLAPDLVAERCEGWYREALGG